LKRFSGENDPKSLLSYKVEKIRDIITALIVTENLEDLPVLPGWRLHKMTGQRKDLWSISISGNWRITFEIQSDEIQSDEIHDLNMEDYH
jgi:toxin HigB-1